MGEGKSEPERWLELNALALKLAESGLIPTQIHFTGRAQPQWDYLGQEAALFSFADESLVVTSCGKRIRL
jgi:hypothetical protein